MLFRSYRAYARSREHVRRTVRAASTPPAQLPPLRELETGEAWRQAVRRLGGAATYDQAFLAVDRLVERYTEERLRAIFRGVGGADRALRPGDFEYRRWTAVFPISYRDFVVEFGAHLESLR